jgi:disulfide bond formation protein DsbB
MNAQPLSWAALGLALVGTAGSLYLSLGMGLKACPLCFYQRSSVMAALAVLALGRVVEPARPGLLCLVALPLAAGGLGVAAFHEWLVVTGALECPQALLGWGTAPAQSLAVHALLTLACAAGSRAGRGESPRQGAPAVLGALALGLALAGGSIASAPPLPPSPSKPYDLQSQPLDMCRPPFALDRLKQ